MVKFFKILNLIPGKGMDGKSNLDKIPSNPTSPKEVYDRGTPSPTNPYEKHCSKHCGGHCNCCDEKWHHVYDITTDACGGNGGNGGDGGNGGPAGILSISGILDWRQSTIDWNPLVELLELVELKLLD